MAMTSINKKKAQTGWAMYDWANSVYNLVITSTIFPAYYIAITRNPTNGDKVNFLGWEVVNSTILEYAIAFAYLIIAILSPILSSMADYRGNKKTYMKFFCYIGSISCASMYFFDGDNVSLGIILSVFAAIGYCGSLVFYNAFLPEIASVDEQDKLSAKGFAFGYIGSVILQVICLYFVQMDFEDSTFAARLSFLLVGLWWIIFAQITFRSLKDVNVVKEKPKNPILNGFTQLKSVWKDFNHYPKIKSFLASFFFYSMGVQTVMLAAALFGSKEVHKEVNGVWVNMEAADLIPAILLIQLVAIGGAILMAWLSKKIGDLKVLIITVSFWIIICIIAYYTYTNYQFYVLAVLVGIVMGGIQSLSRSTYSKLIPQNTDKTTSYFSFYDVTEKIAIVIGMFSFGFIEHLTGNMRNAIVSLAFFFLLGLCCLIYTQIKFKDKNIKAI